jgi:hypothetical protein
VESCKSRYFNSFEFFDHTASGRELPRRESPWRRHVSDHFWCNWKK